MFDNAEVVLNYNKSKAKQRELQTGRYKMVALCLPPASICSLATRQRDMDRVSIYECIYTVHIDR